MTVPVTWETEDPFDFEAETLIAQVAAACLAAEGWPDAAEADVLMTDNEGIRQINRETRGLNAATDVLSFPALSLSEEGVFPSREEDLFAYHPDSGELLLGDIVISVEKVRSQAEAYGHGERRELAFLTAHSLFHLMGYDHETEEEARHMEEKQEAVLQTLGILRDSL